MLPRCLAVVMVAGACGTVARDPMGTPDAAVASDATVAPVTYKGTLAQTTANMFGGGTGFCTYTITFKQLDLELAILPSSKQVTTGRTQNLNVEAVVPTTPVCPYGPAGPSISSYTFASATKTSTGMTLTFQGATTNSPKASLVVILTPSGTGYTAAMTFHRTDLGPPLDWLVTATVTLAPQ